MSAPVYNVSVGGNNNDSNVIIGSANGSIAEDDNHDHSNLANKVAVLENALNLNSASDLVQDALVATNASGVVTNASGIATNLTRLDFHEALVLKNIDDISLNKSNLAVLENSKIDKLATINSIMANSLDNVSHEVFNTTSNLWSKNATNNELTYTGLEYNIVDSLLSPKDLTFADGFNFSCKVTLTAADGSLNVLGYNASAGIVAGFPTISASGTSIMELVMVKDQDSAKVRVWVNGTEDNTTFFPDFTGGRLVVLANPNATFSGVKLTNTTVDLGISSILKEYTHVRIATIQSANPITQQNVDDYTKVNVIMRNEAIRFDPTKDYSGVGYVLKVGNAQYYQISKYDNILLEAEFVKRIGNVGIGADLALGGNGTGATFKAATSNLDTPKDKSVTLSLKYYSKDVAYLRERLTVTGIGAPTVGFGDLTPATQAIVLAGYKASLGATPPADDIIIAALTQTFSGYSLLQSVLTLAFNDKPVQTAPEFINRADTVVVTQTNPSGDFTAQNIESYKQISNKLAGFNFSPIGSNMTITNNIDFTSAISINTNSLLDTATQAPYQYAGIIPSDLVTTSWTINTLDPSGLDAVISSLDSIPDYQTWVSYGLTSIAEVFKSSVGGTEEAFNALSYKTIARIFLRTAITGEDITINDLNGDYTPNMSSLLTGDEEKFRKALAMKENADVKDALNIPETCVFGYSVVGLLPTGTVAVLWYFISPTRNPDNVWLYTRVFDLKTMSYIDADVRREGDVNIITDLAAVPPAVKDKYTSAYSIDLDASGVVNSTNKILWNYTGEGGQVYYDYTDVSDPDNQINKVTVSADGGSTWFTDVEAFTSGWILAGQTPPDASKLNNVYVKTWAEVEARLSYLNDKYSTLITPTYSTNVIDTNLQGIIGTGNYTEVDITKAGAYPITYDSGSDLRILAVGAEKWWENTRTLTDTSNDYDLNALVVSDDGQTIAFCRGQYSAASEGRQPGEQKVFVMKKGENVPTEITLPSTIGPTLALFKTARAIQRLKLNNDGTVLLVAEWFDGNLSGDVLVYRKSGSVWSLAAEMDKLPNALVETSVQFTPTGPANIGDGFGTADMSDDGNVVVGGSYGAKGIQVMRWNGSDTYVIEAVDLSSNSIGQQGRDVKISSDGTEIIMPIIDGGIKKLLLLKKDSTTGEWTDRSNVSFNSMIWNGQLFYLSVGNKRLLIGNNNTNNKKLIDIYSIDVANDGTFSSPVLVRNNIVTENSALLKRFVVGVANEGKLILVSKTLADGTIILEKLQTSGDQFDSTAIYESTIVGTFKLSQFAAPNTPTLITRGSMGQPVSLNSLVVPSGDATSVLTLLKVQDSNVKRNVVLEYPL